MPQLLAIVDTSSHMNCINDEIQIHTYLKGLNRGIRS